MSQPTAQAPLTAQGAPPASTPHSPRFPGRGLRPGAIWLLGAVALLGLATAIVVWADTRPGYDPYGWLVWGKLTLHWNLDTNGAPSWKPLPYLFTVPFALLGHYAVWMWMIFSVAVSLGGFVFAWRIASHLVDAPAQRRWPAQLAGGFAALTLLGIRDYSHFILSSQSDTMIVSLCLAAIDCQLSGRRRLAFWVWVLAGLGRPEAWPFLAAYSVWLWRREPALRTMIALGLALIPLLWFGIPALTANSAFIAGDNALNSPRALHSDKLYGTIDRFFDLHELPVWLAALLGLGLAALRRNRFQLVLAAGAVVWVAVEVAFVLHGYPGVSRYLFEPIAVVCVLAGLFVGRLFLDLPGLLDRLAPRLRPELGLAAGLLITLALCASLVPAARSRARIEHRDLRVQRLRTQQLNELHRIVLRLGLGRILACGRPNVPIGYQSVFAWYTDMKIGSLYISQQHEREHPSPLVNFAPQSNGWRIFSTHIPAARASRCRGLALAARL